jgi:hypothetical protein
MNWEFGLATAPWFGRCSGRCCRKFDMSGELVARLLDVGGDDYWYCIPYIDEIVREEQSWRRRLATCPDEAAS